MKFSPQVLVVIASLQHVLIAEMALAHASLSSSDQILDIENVPFVKNNFTLAVEGKEKLPPSFIPVVRNLRHMYAKAGGMHQALKSTTQSSKYDYDAPRALAITAPLEQWEQLGGDIDGEGNNDYFGFSVSLSADGSTVAIGAYGNDGNGPNRGHVQVYQWDDNASTPAWIQMGNDIFGEVNYDESGKYISLSADGSTVAIGSINNDSNGANSGHVRVYQWDNASTFAWIQMGSDIDGEANNDKSGRSVSLSADGSTVAIGAPFNYDNGSDSGHVRVYQWDDNASTPAWIKMGSDIDGEAAFDKSGLSVSLSADGSTVAIGAPTNDGNGQNTGHVRVYQLVDISSNPTWIQMGSDIDGSEVGSTYDQSGYSISLSADGSTVAIGAPYNKGNGYCSGHVRVYQWDNASTPAWIQMGSDIDGEFAYDFSGYSVSLSADGSTVAIGAPFNYDNGSDSGHVRVYQWDDNASTPAWIQMGSDIDGEDACDYSGHSVSLSADGSTVAIGAPYANGTASEYELEVGHVRVYQLINPPAPSSEPSWFPSSSPMSAPPTASISSKSAKNPKSRKL